MKSPILMLSGFVLAVAMMSVPLIADAGMRGGQGGSNDPGGQGSGDQGSGHQGPSGQGSGDQGSGGQGAGGQHQGMSGHGGSEFRAHRIFISLDVDGSNDLSLEEFLAKPPGSRFDQLDADDDGLISEDEYLAAHGFGYNGGGFNGIDIDLDELRACIEEQVDSIWMIPADRAAHFVEMDVNADGFVDPDEFETAREDRAVERFMLIDTDADGVISESELAEALGEMGQHRSIHHECIDEQRDLNSLQGD